MGKERPLAECTFGWGHVFRLYTDYLEINGTPYALKALTAVRPMYRTVLGIPSARLVLWFGTKKISLRGIPEIESVRFVAEYLVPWCWEEAHLERPSAPPARERQWDEQTEVDEMPVVTFARQIARQAQRSQYGVPPERSMVLSGEVQERTPVRPERRPPTQRSGGPQQRQMKETLTVIPVPLRLLPGEEAYYSISATLCDEPMGESTRITYPAKDYGTLILTSRRIIYIGRKSQVVVDYGHLRYVSRLRGAIAIQSDYRNRREIFEMRRPLECAGQLETILEQYALEMSAQVQKIAEEEAIILEEELWHSTSAGLEMQGTGSIEILPTGEVETGSLGDRQRNERWRVSQLPHARIRNTDDFEDRWRGESTELSDAVSSDIVFGAAPQDSGGKDRG